MIAVIGYGLIQAEQTELNELLQQLYFETLKGYWDAERRYIDESYQTIPFPFHEYTTPTLSFDYARARSADIELSTNMVRLKTLSKAASRATASCSIARFFSAAE